MGNFFEKLKKGMGLEEEMTEVRPQSLPKKTRKRKAVGKEEIKVEKIELTPAEPEEEPKAKEVKKKQWFEQGGQLAVDIYQTKDELVIRSAIAGVKPEDLDISIENDVLSIKGQREKSSEEQGEDYFIKECYWGAFSKEIVLPVETDINRIKAEMKNGILCIRLPKISRERKRKILVKE